MQQQNGSEVARLKERISRECQSANWALTGLADGTAKHRFISRRYDQIGMYQERLAALVGEHASMQIVIQVIESSPEPERGAHE
jgi:hypothetical protein